MSVLFDILGTAGKAGLYNLSRRSLPQTAGAAQLKGLEEEVEIIRDHWGIPHIYAKNLSDLLFAQGFIRNRHATFEWGLLHADLWARNP
mgnify:CR=1 FL=1